MLFLLVSPNVTIGAFTPIEEMVSLLVTVVAVAVTAVVVDVDFVVVCVVVGTVL